MHTPSHYRTKKKELDMKKDLHKARVITSQAESPAIKTVLLRTALCVTAGQGDQSPVLKLHSTVSHANDTSTSFLLCLFIHYYCTRDYVSFKFQNDFGFVSLGVNAGLPDDKTAYF